MGVLMVTDSLSLFDRALAHEADLAAQAPPPSKSAGLAPAAAALACDADPTATTCDFDLHDPTRRVPPWQADLPLRPVVGQADLDAVLSGGQGRPLLVEFFSSNCPVCNRMAPIMRTIEQSCLGKDLTILKINVSMEENRAYARSYGVLGVPTFLFLKRDGSEMSRLIGYQGLAALEKNLAALTMGVCQGFSLLP